MSYQASTTLPYRVELFRQFRRKRTLYAYLFIVSLPLIVAIAVKYGASGSGASPTRIGAGSADLIGLATKGAMNFTTTMFYFATPFLLIAVIALFNGDTVASEASWSTLRYLLASPVPRTRLLTQKLKVSLTLSLGAMILLPLVSWVIGALAFGVGPLQTPLGATFSNSIALDRLLVMTVYLSITLLFVAGLAFYLSCITDLPLGAVGGAIGLVILSNILDAISGLGTLRNWLPTHFSYSWFDALNSNIDWTNMIRGASYSIMWFGAFIAISVVRFGKKDITS